jgi:hypothetical protein
MNKIIDKIEKSKDPIGHLKQAVESIIGEYKFNVSYEKLDQKLDEFQKHKAASLNPAAYVLGNHVLINNNSEIDKKLLEEVCSKNKELLDRHFVDKIDIIRYARFWIKLYDNEKQKRKF